MVLQDSRDVTSDLLGQQNPTACATLTESWQLSWGFSYYCRLWAEIHPRLCRSPSQTPALCAKCVATVKPCWTPATGQGIAALGAGIGDGLCSCAESSNSNLQSMGQLLLGGFRAAFWSSPPMMGCFVWIFKQFWELNTADHNHHKRELDLVTLHLLRVVFSGHKTTIWICLWKIQAWKTGGLAPFVCTEIGAEYLSAECMEHTHTQYALLSSLKPQLYINIFTEYTNTPGFAFSCVV